MDTYKCYYDDCQKSYNSMYNLIRHLNSYHLDNKSYMCSFCIKGFYNKLSLDSHISRGLCGSKSKAQKNGLILDLAHITESPRQFIVDPPSVLLPALPKIEKERQIPIGFCKLPISSYLFKRGREVNLSITN